MLDRSRPRLVRYLPALALVLVGAGATGLAACKGAADEGDDDDDVGSGSGDAGEPTGSEGGSEGEESGDTGELGCAGDDPAALVACVDREAYLADLEFIAQPREPGSAHWQAVQDLCAERFAALGFEVSRHDYGSGVNVVGRKLGTQSPNQQIVLAAHYDHIAGCVGADDNATGTAGVLEAARVLATRDYPRTLIVACWDEEEEGLIGSDAYAEVALASGAEILFNYDFEMIGFTDSAAGSQSLPEGFELLFPAASETLASWDDRGDFLAIIVDEAGAEHAAYLAAWADGLGLPQLVLEVPDDLKSSPLLADLQRSDHASFWDRDVSATMLTDTSEFRYANYHCQAGEDVVELLDHDFARDVVAATVGATAQSLGL
ncbi:M28 family peptidase [Pseudenhygromyxa sp. WMMC2535]|uniref:M28 family peptidase n=1 Tax=Pseudenhygromyxa sp. WMMC2535 TaxID=2712867 RepID=UPI001557D88A|nr:M28 family peptidase [Pseudenhygromyxa sp. WMMC2535]NVB38356.1 M28 family peptidase [Pseudenhygromyxa sp. WMMC2535]